MRKNKTSKGQRIEKTFVSVNKWLKNKIPHNLLPIVVFSLVIFMLLFTLLIREGALTGLVMGPKGIEYSDEVNVNLTDGEEYLWYPSNFGKISAVKIDGIISGNGSVKVMLVSENESYLLADSTLLEQQGLGVITGFATGTKSETGIEEIIVAEPTPDEVEEMKKEIEKTDQNKTKKPKKETVEPTPPEDASIYFSLEYANESEFDKDDDGIETYNGVVDLSVTDPLFSWQVNESHVCTKWTIDNLDNGTRTTFCNGARRCCDFAESEATDRAWNAEYYAFNGKDGCGENNTISVQLLYVDYNLSSENLYSYIYYSDAESKDVRFMPASSIKLDFTRACVDTCILPKIDEVSYKLVVEADSGTTLELTNITYNIVSDSEFDDEVVVDFSIKDAKGNELSADIEVYDSLTKERVKKHRTDKVSKEVKEILVAKEKEKNKIKIKRGFKDIVVEPKDKIIKSIEINNVEIKDNMTGFIMIDDVSSVVLQNETIIRKVYAIDPDNLTFTDAVITARASENAKVLLKCISYNFTNQECDNFDCSDEDEEAGLCNQTAYWQPIMNLTPGQLYKFTINATDPAFYESYESPGESRTISETYVNKLSKTFNVNKSGYYLILSSAEATTDTTSYSVKVRTTLDGDTISESNWEPKDADWYDDYQTYFTQDIVYLDNNSDHTAEIDYLLEYYDCYAAIRNARITIIDLEDYESTKVEDEIYLSTSYSDIAVLEFTPTVADDYLIIATGEYESGSTYRTVFAQLEIDGLTLDESRYEAKDYHDYKTFAFHNVSYFDAVPHTIKVKGKGEYSGYGKMRRIRIIAIRMTDDFEVHTVRSDPESSTTSMSYQDKTILTFTPEKETNYTIIATAQIGGKYTDISSLVKLEIDGVDYADMRFEPKETSYPRDYTSFATTQNVTFDDSQHTIKLKYKTEHYSSRAYIKNARITAIKVTPIFEEEEPTYPEIDVISPVENYTYGVGDNATIKVNMTEIGNVSSIIANISWNGKVQTLELTNDVITNIYDGIFTNTTDITNYTLQIYALDTVGTIIGYEERMFEVCPGCPEARPFNITIYNASATYNVTTTLTWLEDGSHLLTLTGLTPPVEKVVFHDLDLDVELIEIGIDIPDEDYRFDGGYVTQQYAIDFSRVNHSYAEVYLTATGRYLYKCATWNFTTQNCPVYRSCSGDTKDTRECNVTGGWQKTMPLTKGDEYYLLIQPGDPGYIEYDLDFTAPYCSDGVSPCIANSSFLKCRDSVTDGNGPEPNQPNTIDSCTDGTTTYSTPSCGGDESVENISIISLNSTYFNPGDTVSVNTSVYCYDGSSDIVGLIYTNDSSAATPQWRVIEYIDPCPAVGYNNFQFNNFEIDNVTGNHSVRVTIQYNGATTNTCGPGEYDDNDDLVFKTVDASTNLPPTIPTSIECDGGSCNNTFYGDVELNCSGSNDTNGDNITYFLETYFDYSVCETNGSCANCTNSSLCGDCSGAGCSSQYADVYSEIHYTGWEAGVSGWSDPGADSDRSTAVISSCTDAGIAGGTYTWHLQDDSTTAYTEQTFDFSTYDEVTLSWSGYYTSIEAGECLELRCDGTTVWTYCANEEGTEGQWLHGCADDHCVTLNSSNCTFDASVPIRFEAEFSGNGDNGYIDCLNITGIAYNSFSECNGSLNCSAYEDQSSCSNCGQCNWNANLTWEEIGNHTYNETYLWDISSYEPQSDLSLRCRASDIDGSGNSSSYYAPPMNLSIAGELPYPDVTNFVTDEFIYALYDDVLIFASVYDDLGVDTVYSEITKPDNSTVIINMSFNNITARYETVYQNVTPLGNYIIRIVANNTVGNINDSENVIFGIVQPNMTGVKYDLQDPVEIGDAVNYTINASVQTIPGVVPLSFSNINSITSSSVDKDSPQLIETSSGTLLIIYAADSGTNYDLYLLRSEDSGDTWSGPTQVTDETEQDVFPNIFEDSYGNILVAYSHEEPAGVGDIWIVDSQDDGLTWSEPYAVTNTPAIDENEPSIEQDDSGMYYVAYEAAGPQSAEIWIHNSSNYTGGWSSVIQLTNNTYMDVDIDMAINNGTYYFAWAPATPDYQGIWYANLSNPLVPNALDDNAIQITDNDVYDYETSLSIDTFGNIHIGWVSLINNSEVGESAIGRTSNEIFISRTRDLGQNWEIRRITDNAYSDAYPSLVQSGSAGLYYLTSLQPSGSYMQIAFGQRDFSPGDAVNVTIEDKIPDGIIVQNINQGGTQIGDTIFWEYKVVYAGETKQFKYDGIVNMSQNNGSILTNFANLTYYDKNYRFIDMFNVSENTTIIDSILPDVHDILPINETPYPSGSSVLIQANVTDNKAVDKVFANISIPDDGKALIELIYNITSGYYEALWTNTIATGPYGVTIFANDTTGNVNSTESTLFRMTNNQSSVPTSLICNGGSCNNTFNTSIEIVCSGSTDPEGDPIEYFIEAYYKPEYEDLELVNADFETGTEGFSYIDDIYGTSSPTQATGSRVQNESCESGYCLNVQLNMNSPDTGSAKSSGWNVSFNFTDNPTAIQFKFNYSLRLTDETESVDNITLMYRDVSDGNFVEEDTLYGIMGIDGYDENKTGTVTVEKVIPAGNYSFDVGCKVSSFDATDENGECWIDNVEITALHSSDTVVGWREIGSHNESGSFNWTMYNLKNQTDVDFRCRARDEGSYNFTDYHTSNSNATILFVEYPPAPFKMEWNTVSVNNSWLDIELLHNYTNPVVVVSANYQNNAIPFVTRISSVTSTSFSVRLQNPNESALVNEQVHYLVVEEGNYTLEDGTKIEAQQYLSTTVGDVSNWVGESQTYLNSYTNPVILTSVMSYNDPKWQTVTAWGATRTDPPSNTALVLSRNVAEDPDTTRAPEYVGFIVIEQANGNVSDILFESAVGTDSVQGIGNSPPYNYTFNTPFNETPEVALVSLAALDGGNGGWAQLHGPSALTATQMALSVDEDQVVDTERSHSAEQIAYIVFASCGSYPLIINREPETVILYGPVNGTSDPELAPIFFWYNSSDQDNDTLTYQIQIDDFSDFSSTLELNVSDINEGFNLTNYILGFNLSIDTQYYWRVRAYDGEDYGNWSDVWEYYAEGTISFRFLNQNVSFGLMEQGLQNDTTNDEPIPFILENDGNVFIDIALNASNDLWFSRSLNTTYFRFRLDDRNESGSFNLTGSQTSWENIALYNKSAIRQLNSSDGTDTSVVDLFIEVPADEPAGTRSANVNFMAVRST